MGDFRLTYPKILFPRKNFLATPLSEVIMELEGTVERRVINYLRLATTRRPL